MAIYTYEAVNKSGETINGEMTAVSREAVAEHLHRLGYVPLAADLKKTGWSLNTKLSQLGSQRLSMDDIVFFTQELPAMLRGGLPLERALTVLASLTEKRQVAEFIENMLGLVRSGSSFADALKPHEDKLPRGYVSMVAAGEAGGARVLETTLERMAEHLKRMQKIREGIGSAMLYPIIVLCMAVLSIVMILIFVLPKFEPLFDSSGAALPASTKIVIAASHWLRDYGVITIAVLFASGIALQRYLRQEDMRVKTDDFLLRAPKIGIIIAKSEMAKFCNTLGVMLANGVSPVMALSIASEGFTNRSFSTAAHKVLARVREGESISSAMSREKVFPSLPLHMMKIGEETGQLHGMLQKTAEIYDRDVKRQIDHMMTLLTPLTTIVLGIVIAGIIASVLSAILGVNDTIN